MEQANEFELWPSHFLDDHKNDYSLSLVGWPSATFRVAETYLDIHERLGQVHVLNHGHELKCENSTRQTRNPYS